MKFAHVVFPIPEDLTFTYSIPNHFIPIAQIGCRVLASFGSSIREGVIVNLLDKPNVDNPDFKIKAITDCLDSEPVFSGSILKLTSWVSRYYLSSWGEALKCAAPAAIRTKQRQTIHLTATKDEIEKLKRRAKLQGRVLTELTNDGDLTINQLARRVKKSSSSLRSVLALLQGKKLIDIRVNFRPNSQKKYATFVTLAKPISEIKQGMTSTLQRAPKQAEILHNLISGYNRLPISSAELLKTTNASLTTLQALERKNLVELQSVEITRNPWDSKLIEKTEPLSLNSDQINAVAEIHRAIEANLPQTFLLHGVTGSGKTEVYLQIIATVLNKKEGAIILVPEISLTPQTVSRFVGRFGANVAVLHSRLSDGERYDQWQKVRSGEASIVIGARSAIFAPVPDLGLIVIDEEHETSYKQDSSPRYHARDVAIQRSKLENCIVVLGTATPSLESFYHTQQGKFHLISMPSRIGSREMPKVEIIDMREELKSKNRSIFSRSLLTEITDRLTKNEQTILFLNRRGYSSYVFCRNCGHVEKCEVCSVSMTYHFSKQRTVCHHCGAEKRTPRSCPSCTSENIRYFGLGTERVEQEVLRAFPQAKVQRMDTDSTLQKNAHQTILDRFNNQEIDILVGTQMIAKGLDFPNVTLVGVIIADTALNLPDFRASERSFYLLTQVAGRSGRSNLEGKVIVQTYMPDHYGIQAAKNHDYVGFYNQEIMFRKELNYPPLSHVATILVRGTAEEEVISTANDLRSILDSIQADHFPNIEVRGPVAAPLSKIKAKHRWHLLVKCESSDDLRETIHAMNQSTRTNFTPTSVEKIVDIDPIRML